MKHIFLTLLILTIYGISFGQQGCLLYEEGNDERKTKTLLRAGDIINSDDFIPDNNTETKYIRINVHFILLETTHTDYPGNFTKISDGNGNSNYTGYDYANDLISTANKRLSSNRQMNLPPGNTTPVIDRKYQYTLNGVFFHEDNNDYDYPAWPDNTHGQNIGEVINLYLNNYTGSGSEGHANMSNDRYIEINAAWQKYLDNLAKGEHIKEGLWVKAQTLNHEAGHNLSLSHTVLTNLGDCFDNMNDFCSDTPTRGEIQTNFGFESCCGFDGGSTCSNNMMDYDGEDAITPEQLGRVHWTIDNEMEEYKNCYFTTTNTTITSFTQNTAFISKNIEVPSTATITIDNNNAMYVHAEEFVIKGEFEVKTGAMLFVNTTTECP